MISKPRMIAENTKTCGVGSVVANHRDGGESSVVVTTLNTSNSILPKMEQALFQQLNLSE